MSDNVVSHLTSDVKDDTSKDLMTFCMQLVHHSQWKSARTFRCGSMVENTYLILIVLRFKMTNAMLDIDQMEHSTSHWAVHRSASLPETYTGDIIRVYTDDVHTGYVRLIREKDNKELLWSELHKLKHNEMKHGPAVLGDNTKYYLEQKYALSNNTDDVVQHAQVQVSSIDTVPAVHSPYWPVEAAEWITRRRSHGFPSKSVIKEAARYGCDFVQVSHKLSNNENEWRFSFSKAELIIIKSWSISQRIVYTNLWMLNKKIASSNLCSYYFKTLMFWACEEKSTQFWRDDLLVNSVCELIIEMIKWVKSKFCMNYFIPGNNMMDHLIDTDLSYEIDALWRTSQSRQLITEIIKACQKRELRAVNTIMNIELPTWIKRVFVIYQQIDNDTDNYTTLFSTDLTTDLQNALYVELFDIYRGLYFQQKSFSCANESDKHIYLLRSENHLLLAVNLCESHERYAIYNCSESLAVSILAYFMPRKADVSSGSTTDNTADKQNSLNDHNEQKCLLYSQSVEKHEKKLFDNIIASRNINIAVYDLVQISTFTDSRKVFFKEYPGSSPTVNIAWFIAKAYLANLYYTTHVMSV